MGSDCENIEHNPNLANVCSSSLDSRHRIPGYCTVGYTGECEQISPTEWIFYDLETCCEDRVQAVCERIAFTGDPQTCCMKNYNKFSQQSNCFSDSGQQHTCAPEYRGPSTDGCRQTFTDICINQTTDEEYHQAWTDNNFCQYMVEQNTYTSPGVPNTSGLAWLQPQIQILFQRYFINGILRQGTAGQFQEDIYRICRDNPAACRTALNQTCSQYSRQSAEGNTAIVNFCGCHMEDSVYAVYENLYAVGKLCDPLCARGSTIQTTDVFGYTQLCQSSVCIIDDVSITLTESNVGNINFTQACGGCVGNTQCQCIISDVNIDAVESELGNISLEQYCTGNLTCYTQSAVQVPCVSEEPTSGPKEETNVLAYTTILVIFILIVLMFVMSMLVLYSQSKQTPRLVYDFYYT